jgi:glycosyltransferase involved in cell wall biosynthesis
VDLILFTRTYPYSAMEQPFLSQEVEYLATDFERVFIVPENCSGQKYPLPSGIQVEEGFSEFLESTSKLTREMQVLHGLTSPLFFQELLRRPISISQPKAIVRLLFWAGHAELTKKWGLDFIKTKRIEEENCIFYTYWFGPTSTGIALLKRYYPKIILVSRSHGGDMYEERHKPAYIPCRQISLKELDGLFPASDNGTSYMKNKYSKIIGRCETAHLGVKDPGFITPASIDGVCRIVSCSFIDRIKRLDLLLDGITFAANSRPSQAFEWTHLGGGRLNKQALYTQLKEMASRQLPPNVKWNFLGTLPPQNIMRFYRENPVDLYIQVSQSEGGAPVSIQEAISCGIPIVATGVGGILEIVSDENRLLLRENPSDQEIADAIFFLIDHPTVALNKRIGSRQVWQEKFNSEVNFPSFVEKIKSIRNINDTLPYRVN